MAYNIIFKNTVFTLNNVTYSPYWNGLINSGVGYDKDQDDNIIFESDEYTLEQFGCYISHCNNGYIVEDMFNVDLFDFMGHCTVHKEFRTYLILRLQYQWSIHTGLNAPYRKGLNKPGYKLKALIKALSEGHILDLETDTIISVGDSPKTITYTYNKTKFTPNVKYTSMDPIRYMSEHKGKYYHNKMLYVPTTLDDTNFCMDIYHTYKSSPEKIKFPQLQYYAKYHMKKLEPFLTEHTVKPATNVILTKKLLDEYEGMNVLSVLKFINVLNGSGSLCKSFPIKKANSTALYMLNALGLKFTVETIIETKYDNVIDMLSDFQLEL
jgi:hypothetical protein